MIEFNCGWETPSRFPDLPENQVQIWRIQANDFYELSSDFEQMLNEQERKRAGQFKFEYSKQNFIIFRGALRYLLSQYFDEKPKLMKFVNETDGKPKLDADSNSQVMKFNISHSNQICLISLSRNLDVGVDIEEQKPLDNLDEMAKSFLSEREYTDFLSISSENRMKKFYFLWSAKEALLKAAGCGLMIQPKQVEVDEILESKKFSTHSCSRILEMPQVDMIPLDGNEGYSAWLVVAGKAEKIQTFCLTKQLLEI